MNIERMLKILELSQRGIGGEAENASILLNRLLKENNMTINDLLKKIDNKEIYTFKCSNKREKELLVQVVTFVLQVSSYGFRGGLKEVDVELYKADYLIIDYLYDVYKRDLAKEINKLKIQHRRENKAILPAFFQKNGLYLKLSLEEIANLEVKKTCGDLATVLRLMEDIEASNVKKPINNQLLELDYKG